MEVEIIKNKNTEDFKISTIIKDHLYYVKDDKIFKRNVYTSEDEELVHNPKKDGIKSLGFVGYIEDNIIYLILEYEDQICFYNTINKTSYSVEVEGYLLKYITCGCDIILVYLDNKVKVYNISKSKIRERNINVYTKGRISEEETIKDMFLIDKYAYVLTKSGYVYRVYSILYKDNILLSTPLKIIPEPVDSNVKSIYKHNKYFYMCYESFIEVYRINEGVLLLLYKYNTKYYKINIGTHVYCMDSNLVVLDKYPKLLYQKNIRFMYQDMAMSEDYIFLLKFNNKNKPIDVDVFNNEKVEISQLQLINSVKNTNDLYQNLFSNLRSEFTIPSVQTANPLVEAKKILNSFEEHVIDKYKKLYFELSTLNESMSVKRDKLKKLEKVILDSSVKLEERRNNIIERINMINEKYEDALNKVKVDGKRIREYIKIIENKLEDTRNTNISAWNKEKYLKILKLQRHVLTNKIGR